MFMCCSPFPELALFFGMTSAETDGAQVGFSWGLWRCGSFLSTAISLPTQQVLLYSALSTSLHGAHLGL